MARRHDTIRRTRWATRACLVASLLALRPASAAADEASQRREATELADRGQESFDRGDFEGALGLFRRASQTLPSPAILLFEARCLVKLGRLVEAGETYRRAETFALPATAGAGARDAIAMARDEGAQVRARLARLTVIVAGDQNPPAGLSLRLDGQATVVAGVERVVDPGLHRVEALSGADVWATESFTVGDGALRTVTLRRSGAPAAAPAASSAPALAPPPPAAPARGPSGQRTWAWVSLGVGAAGLVTGVTAGAIMLSKKGDLDDGCRDSLCPPSAHGDLDSFRTARLISTVGYVTAGLGLGLGAVLWFTEPRPRAAPSTAIVRPFVGLREAGVVGTF